MAVSLSRHTGIVALLYWIWDGVDRTIFTAIKFSFPARFVSPFGFLQDKKKSIDFIVKLSVFEN